MGTLVLQNLTTIYYAAIYLCVMNIFKLIGELVVIYILYKIIFDFIIPLYNSTKQVKSKMAEMQERMKQQQRQQAASQPPVKPVTKAAAEDYIDYEEVK